MSHRPIRQALAITSLAMAVTTSCHGTPSSGADLSFLEREYAITGMTHNVAAGPVSVAVENRGKIEHELVFFRSELDEDKLPLTADRQRVDEEAAGLTHFDPEAEHVTPKEVREITVHLTPGRYVVICNLPGHYNAGMHTVIKVR